MMIILHFAHTPGNFHNLFAFTCLSPNKRVDTHFMPFLNVAYNRRGGEFVVDDVLYVVIWYAWIVVPVALWLTGKKGNFND